MTSPLIARGLRAAIALAIPSAVAACSSDEPAPTPGAGGDGGSAGGAAAGRSSAGEAGRTGAGTGGQAGSGGASLGGGAGRTAFGGSGAGGAGMAGGGGTAEPGMGGRNQGGAAPSSGGMSAGSGGGVTAAGAGGVQAGAGGEATSGAGAGGATAGTSGNDLSLVGAWDGALLTFPCGNTHDGYNCSNTDCTNNQTRKTTEWTIGGTPGAVYDVTFNVRGVVEAYYYPGATRDGGSIKSNPDLFARGGAPQDSSGSNYDYNTYQIVVTPAVEGAENVYFLNSVVMGENPHATNSPTSHVTFPINYTKTIKVTGGGKVTFSTFDSNCTFLQNCGPTQGSTCMAPRTVSLEGVTPAAPSSFSQPFEKPAGAWGQWVYFDVTGVVLAQ